MSYDLIVVSSYPRFGTTRDKFTVGVADCTKQTLVSLPKSLKILVLAEELPGEKEVTTEENITVARIWQRNRLSSFFKIYKYILKFSKSTPLLLEFEVAMYGNPILNIFFVKLLLLLRLSSRKTYIVLHQVILNFQEISGHIGQSKNNPLYLLLNFLAKVFYKLIILFSYRVIVFEQFLKNRLGSQNSKIIVIPHGVEQLSPEKLKIKIHRSFNITIFGFLAWYKGTDWIINVFAKYFDRHPNSKLKLIVAGGPNPNHLNKPYYQKFLQKINNLASRHPTKIILTGFVPESKISEYYLQADLIVLPYRVGMSSSGPVAIAFAYHRPFLMSSKISPSMDTFDIQFLGIKSQVEFPLDPKSIIKKIIKLSRNRQKLSLLTEVSQKISLIRSWTNISKLYKQCLEL